MADRASGDVVLYATGMLYTSACVVASLSPDEVAACANTQNPTGIRSQWRVADEPFASGEPNPSPCNTDPDRLHYLLSC